MCGRYSLALRPSQVRAYLEDDLMPVFDAPEDEGDYAPRQSYNFAPGYHGIVYRADTPDWGAGPQSHNNRGEGATEAAQESKSSTASMDKEQEGGSHEVRYKLQSMKWGLIPFWTKSNLDYGSLMKTINCRDDSLLENRGMWTSMKNKKRCVVIAQGFYEWLKKGKEKVPHYTKRIDGKLMCFAGLWDCVQYEGSDEKHYTYTIITTSSNKQLNFLHDRMPVILENGSDEIRTWLDPKRSSWSKELQGLLKPFPGELEIYAVSKDVGKVGNNSPNCIIPVASSENKSNIANFFAKGTVKSDSKGPPVSAKMPASDAKPKIEDGDHEKLPTPIKHETGEDRKTVDHEGTEDNAPLPVPKEESNQGIKREQDDVPDEDPPKKVQKISPSPSKTSPSKPANKVRSATSNNTASSSKPKDKGSQKITSFFGK